MIVRALLSLALTGVGGLLLLAGLLSLGWMRHGTPVFDFRFLHLDWVLQPHLPYWSAHLANLVAALVGLLFVAAGLVSILKFGKSVMSVDPDDVAVLGEKLIVWVALETALRDDVTGVLDLLDHSPQHQSLRRAFVRALWGFIEGSVHGLGEFLRTAAVLSTGEIGELAEQKRTIDRVKSTLKHGGRMLAGWEPDFGTTGWEAVLENLKVRDRLMHPKIPTQLTISDNEVETAKDAASWFLSTIIEIQNRALQQAHR